MYVSSKTRWMILRAAIVGEVVLFLGSFRVWHKMNRNSVRLCQLNSFLDYRRWMHENYPSILEGFYRTAEMGGYVDFRKDDHKAWSDEESAELSINKNAPSQ